jgi:hypothetical protein
MACTAHQNVINGDEMGRISSTHGKSEKPIQIVSNIEVDVNEMGWKGVDWIHLA